MSRIHIAKAGIKIKKFVLSHWDLLAVMAIMVLIPAVGFCSDSSKIGITPLQTPLTGVVNFVTGPLAGLVTVSSLVIGIANYRMGGSQNITKDSAIGVGCGAAMTQVDTLCESLGIYASSMLF